MSFNMLNYTRYFVQFSKSPNRNYWSIPQLFTTGLHHFTTFYVRQIGALRLYNDEGILLGTSRARIRRINRSLIRYVDIYNHSVKIAEIRISIIHNQNGLHKIDNMVVEFNSNYPQLIYNMIQNDIVNRIIIRELLLMIKCSICLNNFNNLRTTSCGHTFCYDCINRWVVDSGNCPICRAFVNNESFFESYVLNNIITSVNRFYN